MAVAPTFVADLDSLKKQLRLSGVPATGDINDILQSAIREVRGHFWRRLGHTRVTQIQAYTTSDNPSTTSEYLKLQAIDCEVWWVMHVLSYKIPFRFKDDAGSEDANWNEEGIFRELNVKELADLRRELSMKIENAINLLTGDQEATKEVTLNVSSIEPTSPVPRMGSSIRHK